MALEEATVPEEHLLKKLFQDFGEGTSMHGIGRVLTNNRSWKRFLWSTMFLFGVGFSIYQFVITMNDFYSYPVTTVVTLRQETAAIFPGITICNLNRKRKTLAEESMFWAIDTLTDVILL
ncbi:unnamed protein product [Candidula unifasciata]|uniref:Uncharacterized protein n=1 Tax=Candidula unifasciata TaxID=100452 RepID=A0A8S3YR82_9EUPU|nr:unnamed protein product [Candidula unifasciata]